MPTMTDKRLLAQRMLSNPTRAEALFYNACANAGLKHKRQRIMLGYIVDAYFPVYRIVVEIDGGYHTTEAQTTYDRIRDEAMRKKGYTVLRFTNAQVIESPSTVVKAVKLLIDSKRKGKRKRKRTLPARRRATNVINATKRIKRRKITSEQSHILTTEERDWAQGLYQYQAQAKRISFITNRKKWRDAKAKLNDWCVNRVRERNARMQAQATRALQG